MCAIIFVSAIKRESADIKKWLIKWIRNDYQEHILVKVNVC